MIFVLGEGVLIFLAVALASFFLVGRDSDVATMLKTTWYKVLLVSVVTQLSLYFNDLYETKRTTSAIELASRGIRFGSITKSGESVKCQ